MAATAILPAPVAADAGTETDHWYHCDPRVAYCGALLDIADDAGDAADDDEDVACPLCWHVWHDMHRCPVSDCPGLP